MTDLAPFVAATIRDKVVLDLMEENKRLRKVIEQYHSVDITGPSGTPLYFQSRLNDHIHFDPSLEIVRYQCGALPEKLKCQLYHLKDIEIRRAGSMTRLEDLNDCWGSLENDNDVILTTGEGVDQIEIRMKIEGLSDVRLNSLARTSEDMFGECLMNACSPELSAKVSFHSVTVGGELI